MTRILIKKSRSIQISCPKKRINPKWHKRKKQIKEKLGKPYKTKIFRYAKNFIYHFLLFPPLQEPSAQSNLLLVIIS